MTKVTDREGQETTYEYDALNRITAIHRPNGISTYNTYNARDQITELVNKCDDCDWIISSYSYTYDDRGFIVGETSIEAIEDTAWDGIHCGKYCNGGDHHWWHGGYHDHCDKETCEHDCYHFHNHCGKHAWPHCVSIKTDRTFTYDDAGKLLSSTEAIGKCYSLTYTYEYDLMGNRTGMTITTGNGWVVERHNYSYNKSNQLTTEVRYEDGYTRMICYTYDADGNRISEVEKNYGRFGMDIRNVTTYKYSVENRLAAVYDGCSLLMASAYDGDGNRVFQLNYNPTNDNWRWGGCWYKWLDDSDWWDDKGLWDDYKDKWDDYKDEWFDWGDWYDDWYDRDDHDDDWDDKDEHGEGDKDGDYKQDDKDKPDDKDKSENKDRSSDFSLSISSTPDADTCGDGKHHGKRLEL